MQSSKKEKEKGKTIYNQSGSKNYWIKMIKATLIIFILADIPTVPYLTKLRPRDKCYTLDLK